METESWRTFRGTASCTDTTRKFCRPAQESESRFRSAGRSGRRPHPADDGYRREQAQTFTACNRSRQNCRPSVEQRNGLFSKGGGSTIAHGLDKLEIPAYASGT